MRRLLLALGCLSLLSLGVAPAWASTSHRGWPEITGMLLMNKADQSRPLDARRGRDPFAATDPSYSCKGLLPGGPCHRFLVPCALAPGADCARGRLVVGPAKVHHELLGGHGNDTISAGRYGDVIWGDYKAAGQPSTQRDVLTGGAGRDFIYASHGSNAIHARSGDDYVKAHFGRGTIDCGRGTRDRLFISRRAQPHYRIRRCETISHRTLGR